MTSFSKQLRPNSLQSMITYWFVVQCLVLIVVIAITIACNVTSYKMDVVFIDVGDQEVHLSFA